MVVEMPGNNQTEINHELSQKNEIKPEEIVRPIYQRNRALIEKNREPFDEMTTKARLHADAAFPDPVEGKLLLIFLENEKEMRRLRMR